MPGSNQCSTGLAEPPFPKDSTPARISSSVKPGVANSGRRLDRAGDQEGTRPPTYSPPLVVRQIAPPPGANRSSADREVVQIAPPDRRAHRSQTKPSLVTNPWPAIVYDRKQRRAGNRAALGTIFAAKKDCFLGGRARSVEDPTAP